MRKFHRLRVTEHDRETDDSVRLGLQVPDELRAEFAFLPGQHLPLQAEIDGEHVRRTYSICSTPGQLPLMLGIRVQPGGKFSEYVASQVKVGDELEVMPPFGRFHANIDPASDKTYLAFAAGSGITPIMSIVRSTLASEPASNFVLFYGNRRQRTTMFIDDLYALKNQFPERLQLYFLFTQEEQEYAIFSGRIDGDKVRELVETYCAGLDPQEAFICGPGSMIESVRTALGSLGMDKGAIHVERYGPPRDRPAVPQAGADEHPCTITVIMDGHRKSFGMSSEGVGIVDAAMQQGIELPYSCKGGVCATCRTHLREGEVRMDTNHGLEPWEVEQGFVLACQSHPVSNEVVLDYDKT